MILKIAFHDTRPCLVRPELAHRVCECDFGNPSGHSSGSYSLPFWLCYEFIFKKRRWLLLLPAILIAAAYAIGTGLSRIYLGAHSFDQVIHGYLLGHVIIAISLLIEDAGLIKNLFDSTWSTWRPALYWFASIGFILPFLQLLARMLVVKLFEDKNRHPYDWGVCPECFKKGRFLTDNSFRYELFAIAFPLIIVGLYFKKIIWIDNPRYWADSFKSFWVILFWGLLQTALVLPPIFLAIFTLKTAWVDLFYAVILGVSFTICFLYLYPLVFYFTWSWIPGDFFNTRTHPDFVWEVPSSDVANNDDNIQDNNIFHNN